MLRASTAAEKTRNFQTRDKISNPNFSNISRQKQKFAWEQVCPLYATAVPEFIPERKESSVNLTQAE